jgi:hypothetical protein
MVNDGGKPADGDCESAGTAIRGAEVVQQSRLLRECRTFVRREDENPRAAAGTHGDCVLAMANAQVVRAEVVNY